MRQCGVDAVLRLQEVLLTRPGIDCLAVIDRSFVKDIVHDQSARSIVAAVVAMARNLSIEVIAEGVEDEAQAALLLRMGCASGQGYLFSPARNIAYHELNWRNTMARLQRGAEQARDAVFVPAVRRGAGQFI